MDAVFAVLYFVFLGLSSAALIWGVCWLAYKIWDKYES